MLTRVKQYFSSKYKVNCNDLENQPLHIEAARLNFEKGPKFWLDTLKFFIAFGTATLAVFTFINQVDKDSQNLLSREFIELSERTASENQKISATAIASLETFSIDQTPWYLELVTQEKDRVPYLGQATNLVAYNLIIEAFKEKTLHPTLIEKACVDVLSGMSYRTQKRGTRIDLSNKNLQGVYLSKARLEGVNLRGANLKGANLEGAYLKGANLKGAKLEGANLEGAYLRGANLKGADLEEANLGGANLEEANLKKVNLKGANLKRADLEKANLKRANLKGAVLEWVYSITANLETANLEGADLYRARLKRANFKGANLKKANLKGANLKWANLENVEFQGSSLEVADLEGAVLKDADFTDVILIGTIFSKYREAYGLTQSLLDQVAHCDGTTKLPVGLDCPN